MSIWLIRLYVICLLAVWRGRSLCGSAITVKWSDKPSDGKMEDNILLADRVMHRSNQWPWMWAGKLTCWRSPKDVKISVNVSVWCDGMSKCKLIFNQSVKAYYMCTKKRCWYFATFKGFGWNNVGPASQTVIQHYFTTGLMYRVVRVVAFRGIKRQCTRMAVIANTGQSPNSVSMLGQLRIRLTSIEPAMSCDAGPTLNRH